MLTTEQRGLRPEPKKRVVNTTLLSSLTPAHDSDANPDSGHGSRRYADSTARGRRQPDQTVEMEVTGVASREWMKRVKGYASTNRGGWRDEELGLPSFHSVTPPREAIVRLAYSLAACKAG